MHPFIHTTDQHKRPEHDHKYTWTAEIHEYPTRYANEQHHYIPNPYQYSKSKEPKHTTEAFTRHYTQIWNTLPQGLHSNRALFSFKKKLKKYLLERQ